MRKWAFRSKVCLARAGEHFPTAWATISRHLAVLRDAALIISERDGQQVVYELNTTALEDVVDHFLSWVKPPRPNRR